MTSFDDPYAVLCSPAKKSLSLAGRPALQSLLKGTHGFILLQSQMEITAQAQRSSSTALLGLITLIAGGLIPAQTVRTYRLPSTPDTVYRGFFPRNAKSALSVPSGAIVEIDTLSHQGLNSFKNCVPAKGDFSPGQCVASGDLDPIAFQAQQGIGTAEVLPDATNVFYKLDYPARTKTGGGHVLTGPIYVEGAEPGDTLEVRVIRIKARVAWGYNTQGPGGALPGYLNASTRKLIRTRGDLALFGAGIEIPLKPFQGVMAVAPADDYVSPISEEAALGFVGSRPPGPMGATWT